MPRSLSTLLAIDARLSAAIARAERPRPRHAHQPKRHRVEGQIVAQIALPRFLVWHSYLMSRKPVKASVERAAHRMRGIALLRYAQWADAHSKPLPTTHEVPGWALHPKQRRHERADQPTQPSNDKDTTEKWLNPDDYPEEEFSDDAADWWDVFGDEYGLPPDDWQQMQDEATPEQRKQWQAEAMADVTASLEFDDWLNNTVLNDLQVLQLLESYWNGQASLWAGQETIDEMGIAGDFNLTDPFAMDFLRYQAGQEVQHIDETTRQQLADALWSGWGGEADQGVGPFSVDQLAKYVQGVMQQWENGLSDMSYSRAMMIAVTEVARAETFGQYIAMLGSGVQQKIWVVTAGACQICVTQAEQGPVPIRDQFPNGLLAPPGHPRCFPTGTLVAGPKPVGSVSRFYEGSLVELRTRRGNLLSVTPNHPILTVRGWVKAGELRDGDNVVCGSMSQPPVLLVDPNNYQTPSLIEDVAVAFGASGSMMTRAMKIAAEDLHGDGIEGQIGIVRSNSKLRRRRNAAQFQPFLQQLLTWRNTKPFSLPGLRDLLSSFTWFFRSAHRSISRFGISPSFFRRPAGSKNSIHIGLRTQGDICVQKHAMNSGAAHTVSLSEALFGFPGFIGTQKDLHVRWRPSTATNINASPLEPVGNSVLTGTPLLGEVIKRGTGKILLTDSSVVKPLECTTSDGDASSMQKVRDSAIAESIVRRYGISRFSSDVSLDDIVSIKTRFYSGHVYNLETSTGWYLATNNIPQLDDRCNGIGIVVHNCRCSLSPYVDESKPWNPNQWAWAPDPGQLQRLFQDPSFAAWPQYVANLNDPALQLVPPPPTALGDFGKLQYSDLPQALQQVIDPNAFANNYTDAWRMMMQGIGQAVNQAASVDASIKAAEQQAMAGGGPGGGKVLTLDDILAGETPDDLAEAAAQIRSTLDDAVEGLPDLLANLGEGGDDIGE